MKQAEKEAIIFTKYLVDGEASEQAIELYKNVISKGKPGEADKKLIKYMLKHPISIGYIDSGLALINPTSEARKRLYIMLAILEASVDYHHLFLAKKRSPIYIIMILYTGLRAVAKALIGMLLVKVVV